MSNSNFVIKIEFPSDTKISDVDSALEFTSALLALRQEFPKQSILQTVIDEGNPRIDVTFPDDTPYSTVESCEDFLKRWFPLKSFLRLATVSNYVSSEPDEMENDETLEDMEDNDGRDFVS